MSIQVSRILHAGYIFKCEDTIIAFDPIFETPFSRNCYAFPNVRFDLEQVRHLKLDAVFISHYHDDHCSLESLNLIDRNTAIYMYCVHSEIFEMIKALGFKKVISLKLNEHVAVGAFQVTTHAALDVEVDSIFHIQAQGLHVLNVVDSWIGDETLSQLSKISWNLILWPFQTMREMEVLSPSRAKSSDEIPSEWFEQLKKLKPKALIPSSCQFIHESWSWYNQALFPISYSDFTSQMSDLMNDCKIFRLDPGISILIDENKIHAADRLPWVIPVGDQNLDYQYQPDSKVPSTAEVAKYFPALTSIESEVVLDYCHVGIIAKFKSIGASKNLYFNRKRFWQLRIYDHTGHAITFFYSLYEDELELIEDPLQPVGWITEISIFKFYAALTQGESLTSLYVRINDETFDLKTEKEVADVDNIEDPLVRCLSDGAALAYQAVQLTKILI